MLRSGTRGAALDAAEPTREDGEMPLRAALTPPRFVFLTVVLAMTALAIVPVGCDSPSQEPSAATAPKPPPPLPRELLELVQMDARGRHAEARSLAERYLELHPTDGRAAFIIGLTYFNQDNHGAAAPHFARALELAPAYWVTHHYYGECLFLLGDLEGSRAQHEAHLRVDPASTAALYGIGLVDLEESRLEDAEARFRRAIELFDLLREEDPRRYEATRSTLARCHARLADVHFARDEYEKARDELLASTSIEPRHISAFYTLHLVYRRLGDDALADEALERYESAKQAIIQRSGGSG